MKSHTVKNSNVLDRVRPLTDQHEKEVQPYGKLSCSRPERWLDRPLKSVMTGRMISLSAMWSAQTNYKSGLSQNI